MPTPTLPSPPFSPPFLPGAPYVPVPAGNYTAVIDGRAANVIAGSLNVVNQIGQRSTGGIKLWSALGTVFQYGTRVTIYDGNGTLVYSGYTVKDKITKSGSRAGVGYLEHDVQLMDNCYRADKRRVFKTYLNTSAGSIVHDLLGFYLAAEGVTITASSIASGPIITEVIWLGTKSVSDALTWLAQQAGYWWNIDLDGVLFFQPYGGIGAPFSVDGSQMDALQEVSVEFGNDLYINRQYTKGGFAEKGSKANPLHETLHGVSAHPRSFTLSYPVNTIYQILVNGVDQTALVTTKGSSGASWYYAKGDAVIAQDLSLPALQFSDTLDVYYTGRYPVIASAQNPALIATQKNREGGGTGLVESCYVNTKVHTIDAAFQIAGALLSHYGQDTTVLTFSTRQVGLQAGQMLTVNLPDYGLTNRSMLISSVGIDDQGPDGFEVWFRVTAVGSPIETAQWQTYWQNLMNQSSDPSDFTDTSDDSALALLLASTVALSWTATVRPVKSICPICNTSTIANTTLIVC